MKKENPKLQIMATKKTKSLSTAAQSNYRAVDCLSSAKMKCCKVRIGRDISDVEANNSPDITKAIMGQSIKLKDCPQDFNKFDDTSEIGSMPLDVHDIYDHQIEAHNVVGELRKLAEKE